MRVNIKAFIALCAKVEQMTPTGHVTPDKSPPPGQVPPA